MTHTPVATVWEPDLPAMSLPNGMPWPDAVDDETPVSPDAVRVLTGRFGSHIVTFDDEWVPQPQRAFAETVLVSKDERLLGQGRVVRYHVVPGGVLQPTLEPISEAGAIHAVLDTIKARLDVDWKPIFGLLDLRDRTFFTYRREQSLPALRLADIRARVQLLNAFSSEDIDATRTMIARCLPDLEARFDAADYQGARQVFDNVRRGLTFADEAGRQNPAAQLTTRIEDVSHVVAQPGFEEAASAFASILAAGDHPLERLQAIVEAEAAVKAGHEGGELAEAWDFLPTMTHIAMDELLDRARALAWSDAFTPESWRAFTERESEAAWASYNPVLITRDHPEHAPVVDAGPEPATRPSRFLVRSYTERLAR
jgi:hypothetical protein